MSFFREASDFSVAGGNFYSVQGAQYSQKDETSDTKDSSQSRGRDNTATRSGNCNDEAGNPKTGTFVIYSPRDGPRLECVFSQLELELFLVCISPSLRNSVDSFTANDLACIQANLGIGGCSVSIYRPEEAMAWIEENWESPFVASVRLSGCGGPFAWMLSPEESALAIFGSYKDPTVSDMAQRLADLSRFPVVIRPLEDNPALTLLHTSPVDPLYRRPTFKSPPVTKRMRRESPASRSHSSGDESMSLYSEPETYSPPLRKKRTRTLTTPHQSAVLHALLAQVCLHTPRFSLGLGPHL
ncbi:hypothetical protein K438DRAFT_913029 [Mycena galopus ATCC 62051]|nr:hypothetical protein K438DRAFT_913029 [Mycena galopus ATCC 62051]